MGGAVSEVSVDVSEKLEDKAWKQGEVVGVSGKVFVGSVGSNDSTGVAIAGKENEGTGTVNPKCVNEEVAMLIISSSNGNQVHVIDEGPGLDAGSVETVTLELGGSCSVYQDDTHLGAPEYEVEAKVEESVHVSSVEGTSSFQGLTCTEKEDQPHHLKNNSEDPESEIQMDSVACAETEETVERICDVVHTVDSLVRACCSDSCDPIDQVDDGSNQDFAIIMAEVEELQQDDEVEEVVLVTADNTVALAGKEVPEQLYVEEETLCKDLDVFLYRIPIQNGERVLKASDWDVQNPIVSGALELVRECTGKYALFIYDEDGSLYGRAIISHYPSSVLEPTEDSSRYFLLTMTEIRGRTTRKMGIGFYDCKALLEILKSALTPEPGYEDREPRRKRRKIDRSAVGGVTTKPFDAVLLQPTALEDVGKFETDDYPCQFCEQNFTTQTEIKTHWAIKHGIRHPSDCPVCSLPFPNEKVMLRHRRFAHVFTCPECKEVFRESQAAAEHIRKTHVT